MSREENFLPSFTPSSERISALLVTAEEDDSLYLKKMLAPKVDFSRECSSTQEVVASLRQFQPDIIFCDRHVSDGSWKDILQAAQALPVPPPVLVIASYPDEQLWSEVLNLGAYDVVSKPFERGEVIRICEMACGHSISVAGKGNTLQQAVAVKSF